MIVVISAHLPQREAAETATSTSCTSTPASVAIPRKLFIAERCGGAIAVPRHTIVNFSHQAQKGRRDGRWRNGEGDREQKSGRRITSKHLHALIVWRANRKITGCKLRIVNAKRGVEKPGAIYLARFLSRPINNGDSSCHHHHLLLRLSSSLSRNVNVSDARNNLQFFSRGMIKRCR